MLQKCVKSKVTIMKLTLVQDFFHSCHVHFHLFPCLIFCRNNSSDHQKNLSSRVSADSVFTSISKCERLSDHRLLHTVMTQNSQDPHTWKQCSTANTDTYLSVEVDADVSPHVLWTDGQDLKAERHMDVTPLFTGNTAEQGFILSFLSRLPSQDSSHWHVTTNRRRRSAGWRWKFRGFEVKSWRCVYVTLFWFFKIIFIFSSGSVYSTAGAVKLHMGDLWGDTSDTSFICSNFTERIADGLQNLCDF